MLMWELLLSFFVLFIVTLFLNKYRSSTSKPIPTQVSASACSTSNLNVQIKVFYGSQSGTAEDFAQKLVTEAKINGFSAQSLDIAEYELCNLANDKSLLVFIMATYGDGEPTDNAREFHHWLSQQSDSKLLSNIRFAVFGLGDIGYGEHYNAMGKFFDLKLCDLGADRIHPLGLGNDSEVIETDFKKWKTDFWTSCFLHFHIKENLLEASFRSNFEISFVDDSRLIKAARSRSLPGGMITLFDSKFDIALSIVSDWKELNQSTENGSVHHIELDISNTNLKYHTADNLGIFAPNHSILVDQVAHYFKLSLDDVFVLSLHDSSSTMKPPSPSPCLVRDLLMYCIDLNGPIRPSIVDALSKFASDPDEASFLINFSKSQLDSMIDAHYNILDLMLRFKSLSVPFGVFIELMPKLQPRYYTIASSSVENPTHIQIAVSLVSKTLPKKKFLGTCSSHCISLRKSNQVAAFVRPSSFKLPTSIDTPIMLVGPGVGIAPFRAFIQEASYNIARGKRYHRIILFYGCRRRDEDWLYQQEITEALDSGTIEQLFLAFSREQERKVYVQDKIRENSNVVIDHIASGGYIYICGALNMGRSVEQEIVKILADQSCQDSALETIHNMKERGAFITELWT